MSGTGRRTQAEIQKRVANDENEPYRPLPGSMLHLSIFNDRWTKKFFPFSHQKSNSQKLLPGSHHFSFPSLVSVRRLYFYIIFTLHHTQRHTKIIVKFLKHKFLA